MHQRRADVVAVADEGDAPAVERAPALGQRLHVGQRLARMLFVAERVDDVQLRRDLGDLVQPLLAERADHHRVDPALEVAGHVVDRLAIGVHHVGRDLDDVAAELADADREGDAGAQRGLLEQQADVPAVQRLRGRRLHALDALALQLRRELEQLGDAIGIEIENGQEILHVSYREAIEGSEKCSNLLSISVMSGIRR